MKKKLWFILFILPFVFSACVVDNRKPTEYDQAESATYPNGVAIKNLIGDYGVTESGLYYIKKDFCKKLVDTNFENSISVILIIVNAEKIINKEIIRDDDRVSFKLCNAGMYFCAMAPKHREFNKNAFYFKINDVFFPSVPAATDSLGSNSLRAAREQIFLYYK